MTLNKGYTGLVVSRDYRIQNTVVIKELLEVLDSCGLSYRMNNQDKHLEIEGLGSIVFAYGSDHIVSFTCGWACIDEGALVEDMTFLDVVQRVSAKGSTQQIAIVGTPEGVRGWLYERFVKKPLPNSRLIKGTVLDNKENLGDGYITTLESALSPKLREAYMMGEFVDFSGNLICPSFNRSIHVKTSHKVRTQYNEIDIMALPLQDIIIGMDFGVHVCAWTVFNKVVINNKTYLIIIDEIHQESTNTWDMCQELVRRYKGIIKNFTIYGDATGGHSRDSSAFKTNYDIVKTELSPYFKLHVIYPRSNPFVVDRVNIFESALRGSEQFQLLIHDRCKYLIEDILACKWNPDGTMRMWKDPEGKFTHHFDSASYAIYHLDSPLKKFSRDVGTYIPDNMTPDMMPLPRR